MYVRISYRSVVRCVCTGVVWCVGTGVVRCVCMGILQIWAYEFVDTGVLHFCYGRTNVYVRV